MQKAVVQEAVLIFGLAGVVVLFASCAPRGAQQGYGTLGYDAQPSAASGDPTVVCQHACYRYFECKGGSAEPSVGAQCVQDCRSSGIDPSSVQALSTADCLTIISAFDGGAPIPGGAPTGGSEALPAATAQPAASAAAAPVAAGSAQPGVAVAPAAFALSAAPSASAPSSAPPTAVPAAAPAVAAAPASNACPPPGSEQLAQLLVSSLAWCHVPNGAPGAAAQERVVFAVDGRFTQSGGSATQSCWRATGDQLQLTVGGQAYAPLQLQVSRAANGYPILNTNGKEYQVCN